MKLIKDTICDQNYLSKIVNITSFEDHPNPKCTKLKIAKVDGYSIAMGIDDPAGRYVYFPTLSQINPHLLSYCNLYSDSSLNADTTKKGFFSKNGRVTAIKLQKFPSEGFLLPLSLLIEFLESTTLKKLDPPEDGLEFNSVSDGTRKFWISKKYVVKSKPTETYTHTNKRQNKLARFNRIIIDQFRFHYDTILIKKNPYVLKPNDIIHLSSKWHGTSAISAYVLCNHPLSFKEKIAMWLTKYTFPKYEHIYASRTVIKNKYINKNSKDGFYEDSDGRYEADQVLQKVMIKGMTVYYELVGFTKKGAYYQKKYDYGCTIPVTGYKCGENYKIYVYRITLTNIDGNVHEFSTQEVQITVNDWNINGVIPVKQFYYGIAKDLYPDLATDQFWQEKFIDRLSNDKNFYMELNSPDCINKVPQEGIVIKKETMRPEAWKLKCFKFLGLEQEAADAGEIDIEENS